MSKNAPKRIATAETDFIGGMFTAPARFEAAQAAGIKARVFDWNTAAKIIKERKPSEASAGLAEDWNNTSGTIFRDGKIVPEDDTYVYLLSGWATPALSIDGETIECWVECDAAPEWDAKTYWPESARAAIAA